ncbi:5-formyltetrahydrofolate cyclo-ligase [Enterococcus sp. LJL99]
MEKSSVRKEGLKRLKKLQQMTILKQQKENEISQALFNDVWWQESNVIGLTKSMDFEFDTSIILKKGWSQGKKMVMPRVIKGRQMSFHQILPETIFEKSSFGVEEPMDAQLVALEEIDLLVVPGVVFKQQGFRVGFGGGYYDRLLANFQGYSCSLVFKEQIQEEWQVDSFDLAVKKLFIR